ncbi:MAG: hypothetical protein LBS55_05975 [Prevotellaceae bacterium]|jgi:hypothetical protein|nr:hypothetical protein [Prevotellaceae bacterium]
MNLYEELQDNTDANIVISAGQLIEAINYLAAKKEEPVTEISGCRAAADFLNKAGYPISLSQLQKDAAAGTIPCQKFHNRHLIFKPKELLDWAKSRCKPVGVDASKVTLSVAASANKKSRKG